MAFLQTLRDHPLRIKLKELVPSRALESRPTLIFSLCALTMVSSLLLGGGTHGGFLSDTVLELIALPGLLASLSSLSALPRSEAGSRGLRWPLLICLGIVVVPLIQLVPLPPWLWTRLPQRGEIVTVYNLLGRELPWFPISVSPSSTWVSMLSLLPPMAIFLGMIQLGYRERRHVSLILLGVGMVAAFLGLVQVAQGDTSPLRFYTVTNESEAVGFFANRNHFAALLYSLLLLGAAWATDIAFTAGSVKGRRGLDTSAIAALTACSLGLVVLIATEAVTRSLAGLGLMIVAVGGAFALSITDRRRVRTSGMTPVKMILGSTAVALVLSVQFALYRILDRVGTDPIAGARLLFARNTFAAAKAYMPFGSGFGTFVSVYPMFEPPQDTIANIYANHAHNDLLEFWLEGGMFSILLAAAFLIWFLLRCAKLWRRAPDRTRPIDILLARAATLVVLLLIAHCDVDYPLRTGAMMAVFAFCCALLVEPFAPAQEEGTLYPGRTTRERSDDFSARPTAAPLPAVRPAETALTQSPPRTEERWGEDIEWPEQWRK